MTSTRHKTGRSTPTVDYAFLDAARENILAVGWRRTTLTDVARRAGVSRMTVYRRWPDMQTLLSDLLVREWGALVDDALDPSTADGLTAIVDAVRSVVTSLRDDDLLARIVDVDPEVLLPYLLQRRGRNQDHVLDLLAAAIAAGQGDGSVRTGDPDVMARSLLLALQGFVLSVETMDDVPRSALDDELTLLLERYLTA